MSAGVSACRLEYIARIGSRRLALGAQDTMSFGELGRNPPLLEAPSYIAVPKRRKRSRSNIREEVEPKTDKM
jgi:hypothetical protein